MKITRGQLKTLIKKIITEQPARVNLGVIGDIDVEERTQNYPTDDLRPKVTTMTSNLYSYKISGEPGRWNVIVTIPEEGDPIFEIDDSTELSGEALDVMMRALNNDAKLKVASGELAPGKYEVSMAVE